MRTRLQCPSCQSQLSVPESSLGKRIRCPRCKKSITWPAHRRSADDGLDDVMDDNTDPQEDDDDISDDDDPDAAAAPRTRRLRAALQWPLLGAFTWFFLGLALALATPRLALTPPFVLRLLGPLQLLATFVLIWWNLSAGVLLVGRTGKTHLALPFTLAQLLLFPLLFLQIACVLGAHHYTTDGPDRRANLDDFLATWATAGYREVRVWTP